MPEHPLAPIARLDGVPEAVAEVREACTALRWHPGLRRGWPAARVEAGVRCAAAGLALDGVRVPLEQVRAAALGRPGAGDGVVGAATLGAVRVQSLVMRDRGAPGAPTAAVPLGQLLARLHAASRGDVGHPAADVGRLRTTDQPVDLRGLGAAPVAPVLGARIAALGSVLGARGDVPGLVVAAVALAELLVLRPFRDANGAVARAVFRDLLTSTGVDPVGVAVPEVAWLAAPQVHLAAAAAAEVGGEAGRAAWVRHCADAVLAGVEEGRAVADAVAAGRLDGLPADPAAGPVEVAPGPADAAAGPPAVGTSGQGDGAPGGNAVVDSAGDE